MRPRTFFLWPHQTLDWVCSVISILSLGRVLTGPGTRQICFCGSGSLPPNVSNLCLLAKLPEKWGHQSDDISFVSDFPSMRTNPRTHVFCCRAHMPTLIIIKICILKLTTENVHYLHLKIGMQMLQNWYIYFHLLQEEWSVPFYKNDVLGSFCEWPTIVPLFFYQASGNVLATTRTRRDSISSCTSALTVVHRQRSCWVKNGFWFSWFPSSFRWMMITIKRTEPLHHSCICNTSAKSESKKAIQTLVFR